MPTSSPAMVRSSLEEMLDNLLRRDEKQPDDIPPALPSRPVSRARLPSYRRSLPLGFGIAGGVTAVEKMERGDIRRTRSSGLECEGKRVELEGLNGGDGGSREVVFEEERGGDGGGCGSREVVFEERGGDGGGCGLREVVFEEEQGGDGGSREVVFEERGGCGCGLSAVVVEEEQGGDGGWRWKGVGMGIKNVEYFMRMKFRVWCRLLSGQWELGEIQSTSSMESSIHLASGNVIKVLTTQLLPANPDILEGVDDLMQLIYMNEPSVLCNLHYRYSHDMIYSKAGPFLIAINPFKTVQLYGNNVVTAYKEKLADSPHIYATADAAYNEMMQDGANQSIIISGESGAGKTETAKIVMQYLVAVDGGGKGCEHEVLQTSCILEAFGNAKTSKNDNSSRFGKLISIHFSVSGKLCGASIQTFFLEKSRVVQLASGDRSYHVFYQLCAGAPTDLRGRLNLRMANEYKYLNQSNCLAIDNVDDTMNFHKLQDALDCIRIGIEDQERMFAVLAAVLWLGNVSFQVVDNENYVEVVTDEALASAATLMGCKEQDLVMVLSTRKIRVGKDSMVKRLTLHQALNARDALAKFMYAELFDWLVRQVNKSLDLGKRRTEKSISILDTCGYESFQKNGFEQLCRNYANEKLQQHFNRHLLKLRHEDYEADGIGWTKVAFEDNLECVDLFEKKPLGFWSLLDQESSSPKGTDLTFVRKLEPLKSNPCFKGGRDGAFGIHHYAGEVLYDASGLLEKNRDELPSDTLHLFLSSTSQLLQQFASDMLRESQNSIDVNGQSAADCKRRSFGTKIKDQVHKLLQQLENAEPHFICCIKPNNEQLSGMYDSDLVLQQLRCCRVLEVVKMARCGYPNRITHYKFAKRYGFLLLDKSVSRDPLSISVAILQQFNILPEFYQVGFTSLYFRTGQIRTLEHTRRRVLRSVINFQKQYRGYKAYSQFLELKTRVSMLQSFIRGENTRRKYVSLLPYHKNHMYMHRHSHGASKSIDEQQKAILQLQSAVRGWLARRNFDNMRTSEDPNVANAFVEVTASTTFKGPSANVEAANSVVEDLQRRVERAEAILCEKEEENVKLRTQLQQYENKWLENEAKMQSMQDMWQKQIMSLQTSLAAAKSSLPRDKSTGQPVRLETYPSPNSYDSDDLSLGPRTPAGSTPMKYSYPISEVGTGREFHGGGLSPVDHLTKEFEQQIQVFDEDAKALYDVRFLQSTPNVNSNYEFRRLKIRFETWKKEFRNRLRETKTTLQKLGHTDVDKQRRRWWEKFSSRAH